MIRRRIQGCIFRRRREKHWIWRRIRRKQICNFGWRIKNDVLENFGLKEDVWAVG
jgi:hypothetical protein